MHLLFTPDQIVVTGCGREKRVSRKHEMNFAAGILEQAEHLFYKDARNFDLVVSDIKTIALAEIYDAKKAKQLVVNSNVTNLYTRQNFERDLDPRNKHLPS